MKILTWNVNSIRVRLERLTALLERRQPDVLCLQELKVVDEKFPHEELEKVAILPRCTGKKPITAWRFWRVKNPRTFYAA